MKKALIFIAAVLLFLAVSLYFTFKNNPPLEVITIERIPLVTPNSTIFGVVNKGFSPVEIEDVLVNGNSSPSYSEVLISNAVDGFNPEDLSVEGESKGYIEIEPGISYSEYITKFEKNQLTRDDIIYGVSIVNNQALDDVTIKYKYLGISYETTIHYD